jgi:murein DD-endopeptidase MepM/ murein hydrolase activator NlpD
MTRKYVDLMSFLDKVLDFFKKKDTGYKGESYYEHKFKQDVFIVSVVIFIIFSFLFFYILIKNDVIVFKKDDFKEPQPLKIVIPYPNDPINIDDYDIIEYRIESGDNLFDILTKEIDLSANDATNVINALKKIFNIRNLQIGQILEIKKHLIIKQGKKLEIDEKVILEEMKFKEKEKEIIVSLTDNNTYKAFKVDIKLNKSYVKYKVQIENNLYQDGLDFGIPANIMFDFIKMFSFDIDFQRDLRKGDEFEVLFEIYYTEEGEKIKNGNIIYASLSNNSKLYNMYKYNNSYYDKNGQSVQKSLLKTPINGARVSSNFGVRKHPVLGYSKKHEGKDFAAPTGTPFFAAGSGTIVRAGPFGTFGNYIKVKHTSGYETEYAHASRIASGMRAGVRVRQGQIIGYVGTTGRSTGPHLHLGVLYNGKRINPDSVKSLPTIRLIGKNIINFNNEVEKIDLIRQNILNSSHRKR